MSPGSTELKRKSDAGTAQATTASECSIASDLELQRRVRNFLDGRNVPALRHITVAVSSGNVVLSGPVHTYYERQLAYNCCRRVAGVRQVVDNLFVQPDACLPGAWTEQASQDGDARPGKPR